ncbi:hypothetical protein [Methylophilus sp. YYY-1]|uniref:hypothetical protein n=1 Tax=Methylophilus sp. YYY-1 TaxID=2682087 RepID=UPI0023B32B9B|nr:hypothetical protein [Methylophilus sp. YYY-1]MDF0377682.1 hypothetical protein [Methylophilus sp. YYY-1]
MDMEAVKFGFQVLQFLVTGAIGVYVYMSKKDIVTNERIGKLENDIDQKIDQHGERIARLEAKAEKAPTHEDIGKVYDKINQVSDCVSRLEGEFAGATRTLQLIHETLMERK